MDAGRYEQLYHKAMLGVDILLEDVKNPLKNFNRKKYPDCFQNLMKNNESFFKSVEELYREEKDPQVWLQKLALRLTDNAKERIFNKKWKFQREQIQADYNIYMVVYLIPMIRKYPSAMSEAFSEEVLKQWNRTFGTKLEAGTYDQIYNSFRTGIFGINFGDRK